MPLDAAALADALADRYRIERELGQGGMATVYLAQDLRHDRLVAIKVLRPQLAAVIGADRFLSEIRTTANFQHPHILPLFESGQAGGFLFYVMPYVEGESLRARLAREGALPLEEATGILGEVLDGLAHAHRKGVIHRDVKPDNILLTGRHAVIADFGVAKATQGAGGGRTTTAGVAVGTPQYMAPEQAVADPGLDHRADIYAAAALGYEMLTGHGLFPGRTPQQTIAAHLTEVPEAVTVARPDVPANVAEAIMRGLAKDPRARWQSAEEFAVRLRGQPPPAPRRRWWPMVLVVAVVIALLLWASRRLLGEPGTEEAEGAAFVVAVMPFGVSGSERCRYLEEGLANRLSTSLDGVAGLRSVNAHVLLASAAVSRPATARRPWAGTTGSRTTPPANWCFWAPA